MKNVDIEEEVGQILSNPSRFESDEELAGIEAEYSLVDSNHDSVSQETRDEVVEDLDFAGEEFASFIAEIETEPFKISDLELLQRQLENREDKLVQSAVENSAQLVRHGTNPFINVEDFQHTQKCDDRYRSHSEFLDENRNSFVDSSFGDTDIDPRDIGYSGMITSTQLNMQALSLEDAVEKTNYIYMVSPSVVSATGNARILEGKDTGYNDLRVPLWRKSADTRNDDEFFDDEEPRVGRLDSYFDDIEDYLDRLDRSYESLDDAVKSNWKDTKIKFYGDSAVVEARPVSMQPSAEEDMAVHAFYLGRLNYAQQADEDLMPINLVNRNREKAFHHGMGGKLHDMDGDLRDAQSVVMEELEKAREGLQDLGIGPEEYIDALEERAKKGYTPSRQSAEDFYDAGPDASPAEAIQVLNHLNSKKNRE